MPKQNKEVVFQSADRPDVALITNHGYAGVEIPIGGAPDTGGQVVYVNALAHALAELGYRVTIFARGGFPHFNRDTIRLEPEYLGDYVRYVFIPGGGDRFIRKEDIAVALDEEVDWLDAFVRREAATRDRPPWSLYKFVNTHYWDAAVIGARLVERWRNDVTAEAITELLAGAVPADRLARMKDDRHWRAVGGAPAYHLGALLLECERSQGLHDRGSQELHDRGLPFGGSAATPLLQRVRTAASHWAQTAWQISDGDADTVISAAEKALSDVGSHAAPALHQQIAAEAMGQAILALCSWRAARLEQDLNHVNRHVWTPHSLGVLKEENFQDESPEVRRALKFCERRGHERMVCDRTRAFAATSAEIAERLRTHYGVPGEHIFYFPPCVDRMVYRKYAGAKVEGAYHYLSNISGVPFETLRSAKIVFETSRMDRTKRKDLILNAFTPVARSRDDAYLFIGGGPENTLFKSLTAQRDANPELRGRAFLTGFIPEEYIGPLFSIADVYVSASEMEGFGMSVSQAAAAQTAVISSDLVPFAVQYVPEEALIVPAGDEEGFAEAMLRLLQDDDDRRQRAARAAEKVKALDWKAQTSAFLEFLSRRGVAVTEGGAKQ